MRGGIKMTELKLEFLLEKPELPIEIDKVIVSFFKTSIQNYSEELFEKLYTKKKSVLKKYCFANYLPGALFTPEKILLKDKKFFMTFSTIDMEELFHFYNAFSLMKQMRYNMNQNSMKLVSIKTQKLKEIEDIEIIVKMQSSLIVRAHDGNTNTDIYYSCENPEFADVAKENLRIFLQKLDIPMDISNFSITPVKAKKVVTKVFGRWVDGSIGIFRLTGSVELLNLLHAAGCGTRRSEGHGKWTIVY